MKLELSRNTFSFFACLGLCLYLNACAGSVGVDPSEDPVQPGNEENENSAAANEEGNNSEENGEIEENSENSENEVVENEENNGGNPNNLNDGEGTNNAANEDFANPNNGGNNNLFGGNNQGNKGGNNNLGLNQGDGALVNNAETDLEELPPNVDQGATDAAMGNGTEEVLDPVSRNPTAGSGNGLVRYVTAGGTKMHDRPSGAVVKTLEQGDHPLVSEEGEWARTSDGFYVPLANLTAQPIGRNKVPREWR